MKAMILAAGKCTRVQPLTYDMPKPMIPVSGKPIMAYIARRICSQVGRGPVIEFFVIRR